MKLILGSASPRRKQILEEMGYRFEVVVPDIDEKAIRDPDPKVLVLKLAHAKADAVIAKLKEPAIVITSDQVVSFQGKILEKPGSKAENREMLESYGSSPVETITSVVVANSAIGKRFEGVDIVKIVFRPFSEQVISDFVVSGEGLDRAGGFTIEDPRIAPFIKDIEGAQDSVMGLPRELTEGLLSEAGV